MIIEVRREYYVEENRGEEVRDHFEGERQKIMGDTPPAHKWRRCLNSRDKDYV